MELLQSIKKMFQKFFIDMGKCSQYNDEQNEASYKPVYMV